MERISVRALATAVRLIREPVVVTYSYPRNHPLHGAGEETGVYVPMPVWKALAEHNDQYDIGAMIDSPDARSPFEDSHAGLALGGKSSDE